MEETKDYRPHIWLGEPHDSHVTDFRKTEAERASDWFSSLRREPDEFGMMIICSCGEWTFPSVAKSFAHKHWASCGSRVCH